MSLSTLAHTAPSHIQNRPTGALRRFRHAKAEFDVTFPLKRKGISSFVMVSGNVVENEVLATRQVRKQKKRPKFQYEVYPTVLLGVLISYTILGTYEAEGGRIVVLPEVTEPTAQQATDTFIKLSAWPEGSFGENTRISGNMFCCVYADSKGQGKSLQTWLTQRRNGANGNNKRSNTNNNNKKKKRQKKSSSSSSSSSNGIHSRYLEASGDANSTFKRMVNQIHSLVDGKFDKEQLLQSLKQKWKDDFELAEQDIPESASHVANALKQWVNKARSNTGGRPLEKDRRAMATLQTMLMGAESSNIKQFCSELDMTYGGSGHASWQAAGIRAKEKLEDLEYWAPPKPRSDMYDTAKCERAKAHFYDVEVSFQLDSKSNGDAPKHKLVVSLSEAYDSFVQKEMDLGHWNKADDGTEPDEEDRWICGLSWFIKQKPDNVRNTSVVEACLCPYHLRFTHMYDVIKRVRIQYHRAQPVQFQGGAMSAPICSCGAPIPATIREARHMTICKTRPENEHFHGAACVLGECDNVHEHIPDNHDTVCGGFAWCKKESAAASNFYTDTVGEGTDFQVRNYMKQSTVSWKNQQGKRSQKKSFVNTTVWFSEFVNEVDEFIPEFIKHHHLSVWQHRMMFQKLNSIEILGTNGCCIIVDFAENATHVSAKENQSEHWTHATSTVFPVVITIPIAAMRDIYFSDFAADTAGSGNLKTTASGDPGLTFDKIKLLQHRTDNDLEETMRIELIYISEDKLHDFKFVQHVLNDTYRFLEKYTTVENVFMVSDGCKAQFKQRNQFGWESQILEWTANVAKNQSYPQFKRFEHHFFCTSHGKNLCDSAGGRVKSAGRRFESLKAKNHFGSSHEFYLYAKTLPHPFSWLLKKNTGIQASHKRYVPRPGVIAKDGTLPFDKDEELGSVLRGSTLLYDTTKPKFEIMVNHSFVFHRDGHIEIREMSCFCNVCENRKKALVIAIDAGAGAEIPEGETKECQNLKYCGPIINVEPMIPLPSEPGWSTQRASELAARGATALRNEGANSIQGEFVAFKDLPPIGKAKEKSCCRSTRGYWLGKFISIPEDQMKSWRVKRLYPVDANDGLWRPGIEAVNATRPEIDEVDVNQEDLLWTSIGYRQEQGNAALIGGAVRSKNPNLYNIDVDRVYLMRPQVHALILQRLG